MPIKPRIIVVICTILAVGTSLWVFHSLNQKDGFHQNFNNIFTSERSGADLVFGGIRQ